LPQLGNNRFDFSTGHFRYDFVANSEWIPHGTRI
jgi:hypothetical protein